MESRIKYYHRNKDIVRHLNGRWEVYTKDGWKILEGMSGFISSENIISLHGFRKIKSSSLSKRFLKIAALIYSL